MSTATKTVALILGVSGALAALTLLVPLPSGWTDAGWKFYLPLANSVFYGCLHIGAAILFMMGIAVYKAGLRRAYTTIALSMALIAIGVAQVAVLNAFGLIDSFWVDSGLIMLPFLLSGVLSYAGIRSMAILVGVTSSWAKLPVAAGIVVVSVAITAFLPHVYTATPEIYFDIGNMVVALDIALYALCVAIALQAKQHMGAHYTPAMAWLALGFFGTTTVTFAALLTTLTGQIRDSILLDVLVIISGITYVRAGHTFINTKEL